MSEADDYITATYGEQLARSLLATREALIGDLFKGFLVEWPRPLLLVDDKLQLQTEAEVVRNDQC